jgi:hypothetical protein
MQAQSPSCYAAARALVYLRLALRKTAQHRELWDLPSHEKAPRIFAASANAPVPTDRDTHLQRAGG